MKLTLGHRATDPELTEATPAGRAASFPMADVTFAADGEIRNVPQMIVYVHPEPRALAADQPCPTCGATVSVWFLDCPCGADTWTGCAPCNLTPSPSALGGWVHNEHLNAKPPAELDLFTAAGIEATP